jgi:putative two-component system hydrogenase maturation factor HypX/HoxX
VTFDVYNGAMSTIQCRRLTKLVDHAAIQDTKVLVIRAGEVFSNGIDLNTIESACNPAAEAWANIGAIDDLCRSIITCTDQLVVASVGANAGAGGVMLALGADRVIVRSSVVLNPHYASMGLYGSEYWTYVLPRRVGWTEAERLTDACLPIGAAYAAQIGLADRIICGGRAEFEEAVADEARTLAGSRRLGDMVQVKQSRRRRDEARKPLEAYRHEELGEMSRDVFDNQTGFNEARGAFVHKRKPSVTPAHLVAAV